MVILLQARERFAYLDRTANYTFVFESGFNDNEVFPGKYSLDLSRHIIINVLVPQLCHIDGVPLDGSPAISSIHIYQIGLVVVFYILTTIGIAFAIGCLLFNPSSSIVYLSSIVLVYQFYRFAYLLHQTAYFFEVNTQTSLKNANLDLETPHDNLLYQWEGI